MTFFLAYAAGSFENARVGTVRLGVTTDCISFVLSRRMSSSPFFATIEAFAIIATAFRCGWTLTSHMSGITTAVWCQCITR